MRALGLLLCLMVTPAYAAETVDQKVITQLGTLSLQNASLASQVEELREALNRAKAEAEEKAKACEAPK